jgi:putative ABC transport system ATP-binding protein
MTAISLSNLRFHYPGRSDKFVIDIPEWSVNSGEQIFIYGPSGSGKSTLLNLLSGLIRPVSGELRVFGQRLSHMSNRQRDRFRANHIGYVFQQFNLIPYLNAVENVSLAALFSTRTAVKSRSLAVRDILSQLNIAEADWSQPAANLSFGQQQRVAIARSLINQPGLIIADEPTSALDQANRDAFLSLLLPIVSEHNITLLFISHDTALMQYFTNSMALSQINHA